MNIKKQRKVKKVSIYIIAGLLILFAETLFYSFLVSFFSEDYYLFGLPFSVPMFLFGLTLIFIPALCYLCNIKLKKNKLE